MYFCWLLLNQALNAVCNDYFCCPPLSSRVLLMPCFMPSSLWLQRRLLSSEVYYFTMVTVQLLLSLIRNRILVS